MRQQLNLIILGATGVGRTWLARAFGSQVCRLRVPVTFYTASNLHNDVAVAIHDGSLPKLKADLIKPSLLIVDDFGLGSITPQAAQVQLDVIDRRTRRGSLLITSQYPTDRWHGFFHDPTVADAILDRVVHQAHWISLKGESMRKLQTTQNMRK